VIIKGSRIQGVKGSSEMLRNYKSYGSVCELETRILLNWQFNTTISINRHVIPAEAGIQYLHRVPGFRLSPRIKTGVRPE
jgi:hypothetical protein